MQCHKEISSNYEKARWILKSILVSKVSQSEKTKYCMIPTMCHSGKGKVMEALKIPGCQGWGMERRTDGTWRSLKQRKSSV